MFVSTKLYPCFKFFTSNSLLRFFQMKFRKIGSLSFKLSRNNSRVTSLKSVLNINIEDTRAHRYRRHEGTPRIWARGHDGTPTSKARGHAKNLGTQARGHKGTSTSMARGHAKNLGTRTRGHDNIDGTRARRKFGHEGTRVRQHRRHEGT